MARPAKAKDEGEGKTLSARFKGIEADRVERIAERTGLTVSDLLRQGVLGKPPPRSLSRRYAVKDAPELARILGAVGAIGNNVNQLARHANQGSWPETPLLEAAAEDIQWMRRTLMVALGIHENEGGQPQP